MKKVGFGILGVLGLVFIIGGSVFVGIFPGIMEKRIKEELPIVNGSDAYDRWKENPVPITMKFYFFSNNNPEYKSLDDIELHEIGPFIYDETRVKVNIHKLSSNESDDLISYQEHKTYTFQKDQKLNETQDIDFINFPILGIFQNQLIGPTSLNDYVKAIIASTYKDSNDEDLHLFIKRKVSDLLFDGLNFKLFSSLHLFVKDVPVKYRISEGKSFLEEEWTVNSGKKDIDKIGQITSFDGVKSLINKGVPDPKMIPIWPLHNTKEDDCTELKGTDGTFFAPKVSKDDIFYAFEPQLCRTVFFKFWKETEVRDIKTYRFRVPKEYFQSPQNNKHNQCYCVQQNFTECQHNGVLDISHCWRRSLGAPIVMSAPYFFNGDDTLRNYSGIHPKNSMDDDNYGTYVDIEPMTGMVLKAVRRLQMSVMVKTDDLFTNSKIKKLGDSKNHTEYLIPVFWIEESGEADEKQADDFKSMVTNKKKLANGISITVIVVGALMAIAAVYLFMKNR